MRKLITLVFLLRLAGCDDGHRRGAVSKSADGKTCFGVLDDNGGLCGPLLVDGKVWPHPLATLVLFEPGSHTISCGTEITFFVPEGVVFKFDYWGP